MRALLTTIVAAALTTTLQAADELWVDDYDEGVKLAQEQGKDLLVDFTGSDWCGWCIRLHEEVFEHSEFFDAARKKFILVSLDFPRGAEAKQKVPNPERNAQLAATHKIEGYPTVLLMTPDGDVYARTGYRAGGPAGYVEHIDEQWVLAHKEIERLDKMLLAYRQAEGDAKGVALDRVIADFEGQSEEYPYMRRVSAVVREAFDMPSVELRLRALRALLSFGLSDAAVVAAAAELDPKNEQGLYLEALADYLDAVEAESEIPKALAAVDAFVASDAQMQREVAAGVFLIASYWNQEFVMDSDKAKVYAKRGLEVADDERVIKFLQSIVDGE